MDIRSEIIRIFNENGVDSSDENQLISIDSVQYISIIVEIEQYFGIVLPDYIIAQNEFENFDRFINIITEILVEQTKKTEQAMLLNEK